MVQFQIRWPQWGSVSNKHLTVLLMSHTEILLTSELQPTELKGDQTVADLYEMHQSIQVVGGQDEAIPSTKVAPATQEEVSTQAVLQRARKVLIED